MWSVIVIDRLRIQVQVNCDRSDRFKRNEEDHTFFVRVQNFGTVLGCLVFLTGKRAPLNLKFQITVIITLQS